MSPTLNMILKHWNKPEELSEGKMIQLPFDIESFCAENDEVISRRDQAVVAMDHEIKSLKMKLGMH